MRTLNRSLPRRLPLARIPVALGAAALALSLAACGSDEPADAGSGAAADSSELSPEAVQAAALGVTDPWVKAARNGMTAAFGTLVNQGEEDLTLTGASTEVAGEVELHETVAGDGRAMTMQEKEGGFVIPAGGRHELAPGGDHLMLMGLAREVKPGEVVTLRLELADGSTVEVDATVKPFTGAQEEYHGDDHGDDHGKS